MQGKILKRIEDCNKLSVAGVSQGGIAKTGKLSSKSFIDALQEVAERVKERQAREYSIQAMNDFLETKHVYYDLEE